jgi:KaiC/GvpD/RAD55 family RecA-like ATPase
LTAAEQALELARTSAVAVDPPKKPARRARTSRAVVGDIDARKNEDWVTLSLGGEEICRVRPGGMPVLMGPTGSGKSSLALDLVVDHVRAGGVVIVLSRELPADELVARLIGMQCDASWEDVLRGRVTRSEMDRVTSDRVLVLDRGDATLTALATEIEAVQAERRNASVLVVVDYAQIIESSEREARAKVGDIMERLDEIARRYRVVVLALSQMSRAASRAARGGETLGSDSTDGGAESAAIERWASVTIQLGAVGEPSDDGSCPVEISIGKGRMADRRDCVLPARSWGRTGRWRLVGAARPAAEVRSERESKRDSAVLTAAVRAMVAGAEAATEPVTRGQLGGFAVAAMGKCPREIQRQAVAQVLASGELAEVRRKPHKARHWLIWTPDRAQKAEIRLASEAP